ncbi:MAG: hypothetical protein MJ158_04130 [Alphaproteobacteria bacterium]|nr:hypothetical protein [Alphaproteobacteria bacterium]
MTKKEKIKQATKTIKKANRKNALKRIRSWYCNVCKKVWNWIKNINIAGLINVALLLVKIILFTGLIFNINKKTNKTGIVISKPVETNIVKVVKPQTKNQNVKIQREVVPTLPLVVNKKTGIKPQISVVNTEYPVVIHEQSVPAQNLQKKQNLNSVGLSKSQAISM